MTEGIWDFSPAGYDAGAVMYTGPVLFPAGLDPAATKTAMFVLGPSGALITVPPLAQGNPGLPPALAAGTTSTLAAGAPATFALVKTANGGPGTASAYTVNVGLPQGAQGPAFQTQIISASDLTGTPAEGYTMVYVPAQGAVPAQAAWAAMPFSAIYNAVSISDTTTTGGANRTLSTISVPAQPNLWVPVVWAQTTITGTTNTVVNVVARLNNGGSGAFSGSQVALGQGTPGPGPETVATMPAFSTLITGDTGTGVVPANTKVTIYLNAEETAATADVYSTAKTTYTLGVLPVGIIPTAGVVADVVGPGLNVGSNNHGSFTHTVGANDNYVIVAVAGTSTTNVIGLSIPVTYGGVAMTSLGAAQAGASIGFVELFGLANPPTGAQTVTVTGPSGAGGVTSFVANSVSFEYWGQTSAPSLTYGTSTSLASASTPLNSSQTAICAMLSYGSGAVTPSSASGSTLWSDMAAGNGLLNFALMSADGTGGNVQLTGSTTSSQPWATVLVTLI